MGAHAPSICELPNGEFLAAWYSYPGTEDYKGGKIVFARKKRECKTWEKAQQVKIEIESSAGNPVLFWDSLERELWMLFVVLKGNYWTDSFIYGISSKDNGHAWTTPAVQWPERGMMVRHPPIAVGGEFLLPVYDEKSFTSALLKGRGGNWRLSYQFQDPGLIQGALVRESQSILSIFFRPTKEPEIIYRSLSCDNGRSWSRAIETALPCPLSGIAATQVEGKLCVLYNHSREHKRTPLSLARSLDGGVSWSEPFHLDSVPYEISYPSIYYGADSNLKIAYTFNRRMIKFVELTLGEIP